MVMMGFFDYLDSLILDAPYLSGYITPGYTHATTLAFDDKVRKKIVISDNDLLANREKPIWCMKLCNRDVLKPSADHPNRPTVTARHNRASHTLMTQNVKVGLLNLNIAFVGNSFLFIETLEETLLTIDMRKDFLLDPTLADDPGYEELLSSMEKQITVGIKDFTLDGITKEDTSQYGPVVQLNATAQLQYPIILPTGPVEFPTIQTLILHVEV